MSPLVPVHYCTSTLSDVDSISDSPPKGVFFPTFLFTILPVQDWFNSRLDQLLQICSMLILTVFFVIECIGSSLHHLHHLDALAPLYEIICQFS